MSVKTDIPHKRAFVSLVMTKLTGILTSDKKLMKKLESAKDIHKQYVTAMRYARNHKWGYNASDQDHDKRMWVKELEQKTKRWKDNPECYTDKPIKNIWSLEEVSDAVIVAEAEAPVKTEAPAKPSEDAIPASTLWATPEAEPYLKIAGWLYAIDNGFINGSPQEAKQFISTLDEYTDKLQALLVKQTKAQLKNLLQKVKECEAVLDKSEVEDIWLEVGTEKSELVVTPYSRETVTQVLNQHTQLKPYEYI